MSFVQNVPDSELVRQLNEGSSTAFDEIFNRFADPVHTYIKARLHNIQEADDILQEVFIRLWHKRQSITIHSSLRNYLYTIVQHCISDHLRMIKRNRYTLIAEFPETIEERAQPDEQYHNKQVNHIWKSAIEKLPGKMSRIYAMKNEEHLSVKEIASALQLSEQTVKNQLHSAGKRIVKLLQHISPLFF